jgi:hypothetical protein
LLDWEEFAREVFEVQNKIRQQPKVLQVYLEKCLQRFDGNVLMNAEGTSGVETHEGPAAYLEAIEYLKVLKPLAPLRTSPLLQRAALDHI